MAMDQEGARCLVSLAMHTSPECYRREQEQGHDGDAYEDNHVELFVNPEQDDIEVDGTTHGRGHRSKSPTKKGRKNSIFITGSSSMAKKQKMPRQTVIANLQQSILSHSSESRQAWQPHVTSEEREPEHDHYNLLMHSQQTVMENMLQHQVREQE